MTRSEWHTTPNAQVEVATFTHEGHDCTNLGACISDTHLACYPASDGTVCDWQGNPIGTYRTLSSRPAVFFGHRSWQGSRYYYMRATVNGRTYSLRGFGVGMLARGKACK